MLCCYQPKSLFDLIRKEELRLFLAGVCAEVQLPAMLVNKDGETAHRSRASGACPHPCEFCREFRRDPEAKAACNNSEKQVGLDVMAAAGDEPWVGPCHMQLLGIGLPVRVGRMTLGAALTGQLRRAELDGKFEQSIASWIPKLGEARVDELRALYFKLPLADEAVIADKREKLQQGVAAIESIASGVFRRERNAAEKALFAELGFELSKATREHAPLQAAIGILGRALGEFLGSPEYCVALYEGKGGRRVGWVAQAWQDVQPAKFVSPSVVDDAASEMKCFLTKPDLLREVFSSVVPDLGIVVSDFEYQGHSHAVMFAARTAAARLKKLPELISRDFWSDIATTFRAAFSEIEYGAQLRRKVKELRESEQALRAYVEKTVHDLKMPLSGVKLYAEDALQWPMDALAKDRLGRVIQFSEELGTRIHNLIRGAAEEVGEGQQRVAPQKVNVKEIVLRVIERYRHHIKKRKHRKTIDMRAKADPAVYGDPLELETVFDNLVDNAVKYTYPGKEVRAVLDADEVELHFEIENYGLGILPDEKDKIWERYYRGKHDDDWSGAVSGSGIGLFVVKQTVDAYGGRVWFETRPSAGKSHDPQERASGRGYVTKFHVTLPLDRS